MKKVPGLFHFPFVARTPRGWAAGEQALLIDVEAGALAEDLTSNDSMFHHRQGVAGMGTREPVHRPRCRFLTGSCLSGTEFMPFIDHKSSLLAGVLPTI